MQARICLQLGHRAPPLHAPDRRSAAACRTFAQVALHQLLQLGGSVCGCPTSPLQSLPRFFNHNPDMLRLRAGLEPHLTSNDPEVLLSPAGIFAKVRPRLCPAGLAVVQADSDCMPCSDELGSHSTLQASLPRCE